MDRALLDGRAVNHPEGIVVQKPTGVLARNASKDEAAMWKRVEKSRKPPSE